MASQKRLRAAQRKPPVSGEQASGASQRALESSGDRAKLIPLQARLLPPSFLEADPWMWLEFLLRKSAPPRATSYALVAFPREPAGPPAAERYRIQPFALPKLKGPCLAEVQFYADSGEQLTTASRVILELGQPRQ